MNNKRKINEIIIHCTDTDAFISVPYEDLYKWHVKERGFSDIGYHYVVQPSGDVMVCRPLYMVGAHCKNHNAHSIGIAYAGGRINDYYCDTRTIPQKKSLNNLIHRLCNEFPIVKISGHKDYARRACPCFDARSEYSHFIKQLL